MELLNDFEIDFVKSEPVMYAVSLNLDRSDRVNSPSHRHVEQM